MDRHPAQVVQRRVAGPEVVQRDPDPGRGQLAEPAQRRLGVLHQGRLGDLQDQPGRVDAGLVDQPHDVADQGVVPQLRGGQVHVQGERGVVRELVPQPGQGAHPGDQHLPSHLVDQPGGLGQRDEQRGRHPAAGRVVPAGEGLDPVDRAGRQVDQRLVVGDQVAGRHRLGQVDRQLGALHRVVVHLRLEGDRPALAGGLGGVERHVRVPDQRHRVDRAGDAGRDPGADPQPQRPALQLDRLLQRLVHLADQLAGLLAVDVHQQQRELVPAEPGDQVVPPGDPVEPGPDHLQQPVAEPVPEAVVEVLEAVQVQQHHRQRHRGTGQQLGQLLGEQVPVRQRGELVVGGRVAQLAEQRGEVVPGVGDLPAHLGELVLAGQRVVVPDRAVGDRADVPQQPPDGTGGGAGQGQEQVGGEQHRDRGQHVAPVPVLPQLGLPVGEQPGQPGRQPGGEPGHRRRQVGLAERTGQPAVRR